MDSRHPEITQRVSQNLTTARDNVTERQIRNWFSEIKDYLVAKNLFEITKCPNRVFNADESAFYLQPKGDKVLTRKGEKNVYRPGNDEKECITVLVTANAEGIMAPPMIVFTYTRVPGYISANIPESWGIENSENGWMCSATFYEYMTNIFEPWLTEQKIARPIVFFVDGHVSHLTLHLSNFCVEKQIELISLFPNSTHLLQPMDVAVFRPLKHAWKLEVQQWRLDNSGHKLQKQHFGKVLEAALKHISEDTIRNGFKVSGLCPFNEHNVKFTKLSKTSLSEENRGGNLAINAKILLSGLEDRIGRERKNSFEMCLLEGNIEWNGPIEEKTLYEIWKSIKLETNERQDDGRNNEEAVVLQPLHSSPPLNLNNEKNTDYESAHPHCTPIKDAISEEVNLQPINSKKEDYLDWEEFFMATAFLAAKRSKDPHTQVGACIVNDDKVIVGVGYNGMPKGCHDDEFPWGKNSDDPLEKKSLYG
ncbi:hypothetical protein NQ314_001969 [Rhamnusium bicolor]|uniref:dCMP deaminase n=1 Tax=Rhamnusium bicolor TaxID=1586634 RepID=A0AAV8ZT20_9CUCU|nr:hypothetical protein NQ314_001969 [Rhamnusium bicolor]